MALPSEKYSNSPSVVTSANAKATHAAEPNNTRPTTNGIRTAAVATRFQVIKERSPDRRLTPSHHSEGRKSPGRVTNEEIQGKEPGTHSPATRAGIWELGPCSRMPP